MLHGIFARPYRLFFLHISLDYLDKNIFNESLHLLFLFFETTGNEKPKLDTELLIAFFYCAPLDYLE